MPFKETHTGPLDDDQPPAWEREAARQALHDRFAKLESRWVVLARWLLNSLRGTSVKSW